jgi:hypothetical protein
MSCSAGSISDQDEPGDTRSTMTVAGGSAPRDGRLRALMTLGAERRAKTAHHPTMALGFSSSTKFFREPGPRVVEGDGPGQRYVLCSRSRKARHGSSAPPIAVARGHRRVCARPQGRRLVVHRDEPRLDRFVRPIGGPRARRLVVQGQAAASAGAMGDTRPGASRSTRMRRREIRPTDALAALPIAGFGGPAFEGTGDLRSVVELPWSGRRSRARRARSLE